MSDDPWRGVELPRFVRILGKLAHCKGMQRLRSDYALTDKTTAPDAPRGWYENDELGVSAVIIQGRIDCIMFCAEPHAGFGGPRTPCFLGAHYGMSRDQIRKRFARPDEVVPSWDGTLAHA